MEKGDFSWDKTRKGLKLSVFVSLGAIIILLLRGLDENTITAVNDVKCVYLGVGVGLLICTWFLDAVRTMFLIRLLDGKRLRFSTLLRISLATVFAANVTPFASGAIAAQSFFLHRKGMPVGQAAVAALLRLFMNSLFFAFSAPVLFLGALGDMIQFSRVFYIGFGLGLTNLIVLTLALSKAESVKYLINRICDCDRVKGFLARHRSAVGFKERLMREIDSFARTMTVLRSETTGLRKGIILGGAVLVTIVFWLLFLSIAPLILLSLGVSCNWLLVIGLQMVFFYVAPYIPIPGASGAAELGTAALFARFVPQSLLALFVLIWRVFCYYGNTIMGGAAFITLMRSKDRG